MQVLGLKRNRSWLRLIKDKVAKAVKVDAARDSKDSKAAKVDAASRARKDSKVAKVDAARRARKIAIRNVSKNASKNGKAAKVDAASRARKIAIRNATKNGNNIHERRGAFLGGMRHVSHLARMKC